VDERELASLAALRDRDAAREGLMVLEGALLLERALAAGAEPLGALAVPAAAAGWEAAAAGRFPVFPMSEGDIARVSGFPFHRGVLAVARRPRIGPLRDPPSGHALCLWGLADPANLGALARTGASLGAGSVVLGPGSADPYSRIALRTSMGAFLSMPVFRSEDAAGCARSLEEAGLASVAAVARGGSDPRGLREDAGRFALFLGNEGEGLDEAAIGACRLRATVPMSGKTDSLNVAAAGAILMWELFAGERSGLEKECGTRYN